MNPNRELTGAGQTTSRVLLVLTAIFGFIAWRLFATLVPQTGQILTTLDVRLPGLTQLLIATPAWLVIALLLALLGVLAWMNFAAPPGRRVLLVSALACLFTLLLIPVVWFGMMGPLYSTIRQMSH